MHNGLISEVPFLRNSDRQFKIYFKAFPLKSRVLVNVNKILDNSELQCSSKK